MGVLRSAGWLLCRVLLAAACALMLLAGVAAPASANGIGDVYVGSGSSVAEVYVAAGRVVNRVSIGGRANALAFANDGRTLFVGDGTPHVAVVDIASISLTRTLDVPGTPGALAVPEGTLVAAAQPTTDRIAFVDPSSGTVTLTDPLPGPVDVLAADRREPLLLAGAEGGRWAAVVNPATRAVRTLRIPGLLSAAAIAPHANVGYITTRSPSAVVAVDLETATPLWRRQLSVVPVGVAAYGDAAIVASDSGLWEVSSSSAREAAPLAAATAVTVSDDGAVILVLDRHGVTAMDLAAGTARDVAVAANPDALAAAPRPSSLLSAGATGSPGQTLVSTLPPTNATLAEALATITSARVPPAVIAGALLLLTAVAASAWASFTGHE